MSILLVFFFIAGWMIRHWLEAIEQRINWPRARDIFALIICLWGSFLLFGCAHYPVPEFNGPGGDLVSISPDGFTINEQGYRHLIGEGARPDQFKVVPGGYFVTNGQWHDINAIRERSRP